MASEEAKSLAARRKNIGEEYKSLISEAAGRAFTHEERTKLDGMDSELGELDKRLKSTLDIEARGKETDEAFAELEKRNRSNVPSALGSGWSMSPT